MNPSSPNSIFPLPCGQMGHRPSVANYEERREPMATAPVAATALPTDGYREIQPTHLPAPSEEELERRIADLEHQVAQEALPVNEANYDLHGDTTLETELVQQVGAVMGRLYAHLQEAKAAGLPAREKRLSLALLHLERGAGWIIAGLACKV